MECFCSIFRLYSCRNRPCSIAITLGCTSPRTGSTTLARLDLIQPGKQLINLLHKLALTIHSEGLCFTLDDCFTHTLLLLDLVKLYFMRLFHEGLDLGVVLLELCFDQIQVFIEPILDFEQTFLRLQLDLFL